MKKIKILTIILLVVLISIVSFVGIYVPSLNTIENSVKQYSFSKELSGNRLVVLTPSDEQEDKLSLDNFEETKSIIEERLESIGESEYSIKLNEETGDIYIELEEDSNVDNVVYLVMESGKFEIQDTETGEVLMDNSDIELSNVMYGQEDSTSTSVTVYLNIEFTDEGTEKLKEISNTYIEYEELIVEIDETTGEESEETTTTEKTVTLYIDDVEIMSTSFDEELSTGSLQLSVGTAATTDDDFNEQIDSASSYATKLDSGVYPLEYDLEENEYVYSNISGIELVNIVTITVIIIGCLILIGKYKKDGIISSIMFIGFIATLLLIIRYTNVILSITGIAAFALVSILNIIFSCKMLEMLSKGDSRKELFIYEIKSLLPVLIISIAFCFISWTSISSFGDVMFWGIFIMFIYNFIITINVLELIKDKKRK